MSRFSSAISGVSTEICVSGLVPALISAFMAV
jgi:hypothetical protein